MSRRIVNGVVIAILLVVALFVGALAFAFFRPAHDWEAFTKPSAPSCESVAAGTSVIVAVPLSTERDNADVSGVKFERSSGLKVLEVALTSDVQRVRVWGAPGSPFTAPTDPGSTLFIRISGEGSASWLEITSRPGEPVYRQVVPLDVEITGDGCAVT